MKRFTTESKMTPTYATQQMPGDKHNEQAVVRDDEYVKRAYENIRKWRQNNGTGSKL